MKLPIAALLACLVPFPVTMANADPLADLLSPGGGRACFDRVYDAAHLARVPAQDTRSVRLSLAKDDDTQGAFVRIVRQGKERTDIIVGECSWTERADLDSMGKPLLGTFKGGAGLDCHAYSSISMMSAEEGGDFVVDLRDGRSVMLHLPDVIAAWPTFQRRDTAGWEEFGPHDRVFRVDHAEIGLCQPIDDALHILP